MTAPLVVVLLEAFGWRVTAFGSGVLVLVAGLPLAQVLKHHPADIGLAPDGDDPVTGPRVAGGVTMAAPTPPLPW